MSSPRLDRRRAGSLVTLLLLGLPVAAASFAATPARDCKAACATRTAACSQSCALYGGAAGEPGSNTIDRACRKAVLQACRRHGVATCQPPTTTATGTTSTSVSATTTSTLTGGVGCKDLATCVNGCGDPSCVTACEDTASTQAVQLLQTLVTCVQDACPTNDPACYTAAQTGQGACVGALNACKADL